MLLLLNKLNEPAQKSLFDEETTNESFYKQHFDKNNYARLVGEFWTSKQRQANSLHEIAY